MWRSHTLAAVLATAFLTSGCGGDGDGSSGSDATFGTCDRKELVGGCIESTGSAGNIQNQKAGCIDAGGTWTTEACPTTDLIGCCAYTFGLEFRECWYANTSTADPEASCAKMEGSVWTPAH